MWHGYHKIIYAASQYPLDVNFVLCILDTSNRRGGKMASFDSIKVGDILYDCHRTKMGNTTMSRMGTWDVKVIELDVERRRALCSWNGNKADWWYEGRLSKLRRSPPKKKV